MFSFASRLFLALLVVSAELFCVAGVANAQELTEADRAIGKEIQNLIIDAQEAFIANRLDDGAELIRNAQEKLVAVGAAGNASLLTRLKPSYRVIKKAHEVLQTKGYNMKALPIYSSLLNNNAAAGVESTELPNSGLTNSGLLNSELPAAIPTPESVKELITIGGELFKQKRFYESADHIRDAQTQIVKLVSASDPDAADQYKKDYQRIGKAQTLLTSKGHKFEPQPEFDSLPGSGAELETSGGSGTKLAATDTSDSGSAQSMTDLSLDNDTGEQAGGSVIPLTGIDKIRADRKQVFVDMFTLYSTVKDDASANAAIPKFQELTKRLEAIGDETAVVIANGGSTTEFYNMFQAEKLEIMQMAKKRKPVDLSKYPVLKQELQKLQSALQSSGLRR